MAPLGLRPHRGPHRPRVCPVPGARAELLDRVHRRHAHPGADHHARRDGEDPYRARRGGDPRRRDSAVRRRNEYVVRARIGAGGVTAEGTTQATAAAVDSALAHGLGAAQYRIVRTEAVGPKVGRELQGKAFLAIFFSFIVTLVYLWYRFEWRFGLAAVLATLHDILTTIAFIRYLNLEVSLVVVGAVLTMIGYSLNDTIIIFDRVRENLRKFRRQNLYEILNLSINETLPRSVLTHGTTMATTLALVLLAGEVLRPFALVMTFAIFTGTFSSIYIAAPILMYIEKRWPGEDARGARAFRPAGAVAPEPRAAPAPPVPPAPSRPQPTR